MPLLLPSKWCKMLASSVHQEENFKFLIRIGINESTVIFIIISSVGLRILFQNIHLLFLILGELM